MPKNITFNPFTGTFDFVTPISVEGAPDPLAYDPLTGILSLPEASSVQNGYLSSTDWSIFNSKLDTLGSNYILNPDAEIDADDWNFYNNVGRTIPAFLVNQDLTFTAVASGNTGNGIIITYFLDNGAVASNPSITINSPTQVSVGWYNGPTVSNNPTATQLKTAWDANPSAVAIATVAITGTASNLQYIVGSETLSGGGDTAPTNGTGGVSVGITLIRETSSPLAGIADFLFSKDAANRQGQGISTDFVIDRVDAGNELQISFAYEADSGMTLGSSSDVTAWIYDVTNNISLPITPVNTIAGPVSTVKTFIGKFLTDGSSLSYRLIYHISTQNTTAWNLKLDSIIVTSDLNASAATMVPSVVLEDQPVSVAVTDHMAVVWKDGASSWVPATYLDNADHFAALGFATDIAGGVADIYVRGFMDGFSFGPFAGFNQYIDPANPGMLTPLPSPFTDDYIIMGKGISATAINIAPIVGYNLITSKGGLLTNAGANNGTGDQVLSVGANGNVLIANSAIATGLQWAPSVVTAAPFTYTLATRTLTIATATNSVAGVLSAADHTIFAGYAATIALKANIASPTFTGVVTSPSFIGALTGNASTATSATSFTGSLVGDVTGTQGATVIAAATVTGKLLTGFVSGAGTVAATDSILTAFNKTNGNVALKAPLATPIFTGDINSSTGNVLISTIGKGLEVKTGTNAKIGTAVLVAGTITVANTSITANSRIFLTVQSLGTVAVATPIAVTAKVVGTSFTISSSAITDTSTIAWMIVESIP